MISETNRFQFEDGVALSKAPENPVDPAEPAEQRPLVGDRYDWTTGVPENGNDWRKFRAVPRLYRFRPLVSEVSKGGWQEGVGDERVPKYSENCSPELCSPSSNSESGIEKRAQKRGLNLWHRKDLLAQTPSARQPHFQTSDCFLSSLRGQTAKTLICTKSGVSADSRKSAEKCRKVRRTALFAHFLYTFCAKSAVLRTFRHFSALFLESAETPLFVQINVFAVWPLRLDRSLKCVTS